MRSINRNCPLEGFPHGRDMKSHIVEENYIVLFMAPEK
jgi:hypothetical protein